MEAGKLPCERLFLSARKPPSPSQPQRIAVSESQRIASCLIPAPARTPHTDMPLALVEVEKGDLLWSWGMLEEAAERYSAASTAVGHAAASRTDARQVAVWEVTVLSRCAAILVEQGQYSRAAEVCQQVRQSIRSDLHPRHHLVELIIDQTPLVQRHGVAVRLPAHRGAMLPVGGTACSTGCHEPPARSSPPPGSARLHLPAAVNAFGNDLRLSHTQRTRWG